MATKQRPTKKTIRNSSATARKRRTVARLRRERMPVLQSLPRVEDERTHSPGRAAKLRPAKQILDLADLMYRYHWAVRDAELNGRPAPPGLNPDIVMEWDYAVRWLTGYLDQAWDDISLDI